MNRVECNKHKIYEESVIKCNFIYFLFKSISSRTWSPWHAIYLRFYNRDQKVTKTADNRRLSAVLISSQMCSFNYSSAPRFLHIPSGLQLSLQIVRHEEVRRPGWPGDVTKTERCVRDTWLRTHLRAVYAVGPSWLKPQLNIAVVSFHF